MAGLAAPVLRERRGELRGRHGHPAATDGEAAGRPADRGRAGACAVRQPGPPARAARCRQRAGGRRRRHPCQRPARNGAMDAGSACTARADAPTARSAWRRSWRHWCWACCWPHGSAAGWPAGAWPGRCARCPSRRVRSQLPTEIIEIRDARRTDRRRLRPARPHRDGAPRQRAQLPRTARTQRGRPAVRARPSCRRILESASDAIIVTDARLSIVMANSAALRCFGMTREAIVGTTLEHLFPERLRQPQCRAIDDAVDLGRHGPAPGTDRPARRRQRVPDRSGAVGLRLATTSRWSR